jgi:predicted RNA-binding Zn-ribbon protein involved in translation (DUF1610 family)
MGLLGFLGPPEAEPISSRRDFSIESYYCTNCGGMLTISSVKGLRPCPRCANSIWEASEHTRQAAQTSPSPATRST